MMVRPSSCRKPSSLRAERWLCLASGRGRILATVLVTVQAVASVHHRSRLSVTPWKTQCAQSVHYGWMLIHGTSKHRPSKEQSVVLVLEPAPGNVVHGYDRSVPGRGRPGGFARPGGTPVRARRLLSVYQANPMGPFRVKGTATPEVKFLDRCKTPGSEGVLQGCVRRSRMRVWGAKMIRHRRSPAL